MFALFVFIQQVAQHGDIWRGTRIRALYKDDRRRCAAFDNLHFLPTAPLPSELCALLATHRIPLLGLHVCSLWICCKIPCNRLMQAEAGRSGARGPVADAAHGPAGGAAVRRSAGDARR